IPLYVGDEFKKRVTSRNGISVDTYYRILAIDMLPADMDRILYLDVDMVVKGDLRELYDTDLSGYAFGVCEDIFGKINGFHEANKRRLGIPGEYSYFNAGVMLFNLEYLRADGAAEKLLDAIYKNYERYEYNDQDVMNELYYDKLLYLPWNRYNLPPAYYFVNRFDYADTADEDIQVLDFLSYDTLRGITDDELKICENVMDSLYRRAHIIHYMGNTKPWSKTREESAPYNLFDWAYKNALDRFEGAGEPDRKLRVVFFPYKIQMWDSLSSVYQAAIDDPHCEVSVVPIPYRQYDKGADRWNECYEGEAFAKLFQVEDHRKYMGGAAHETVDIGYIHNPFDELNSVTRVVSDFYSYNLKKYVRKLIYVPYYVTGGFMSEAYVQLSSNTYVDVHVAQCENYIRAFESRSAADKVIPLGSPKLDRVIELTRENVSYPPEWGLQKTGKKLVFVNTSINNLLQFGDYALKKLKKIFEAVEGRDDIFIVWRPHPLLKSTISAMRPELSEMYEELLSYFNDNSIGVYDTTDDISRVVAVCDAYVGEESTSVINLFAVVGKPVYIINYEIDYEDAPDERAWLRDVKKDASGSTYALTCAGGLQTLSELKADDDGNCRRLAAQLHSEDGDIVWHSPYSRMESFEDDLYLTPFYAAQPAAFDHESRQVVKLWGEDMPDALMYIGSVIYKDRIYYIPCSMDMMCVMELKKQGVDFIAAPFYAWKSRVRGDSYAVTGYVSCGNMLYMTSIDSNIILGYDMDTGESRMYLVTADDFRFSCVDTDGEYLYLSEALTGSVFRWSEKKESAV
ncbi:MAG: glycosyltransferase family 8 protein, partial [Oscillospiraceae bacterium]|nr:glycosyltransferase family 8 protein [Oscillospiraceae bacterium]